MGMFNKEDIELYFNIMGIDKSSIKKGYEKGILLPSLGDLYDKEKIKDKLPKSSRRLSYAMGVLASIVKDDFWYETKEEQEMAFNSALEIIEDLSCFQVTSEFDPEINFERTTNLLATIVIGLCDCDDLNRFRLYQKNASFSCLYNGKKDYENMSQEMRIVHLLIAYSKFVDIGKDDEMFDENNNVSYERLCNLVTYCIKNNIPLKEDSIEKSDDVPKKLTFVRPTLNELRKVKES